MYRVLYKSNNAGSAWSSFGSYGSEQSAMAAADRIAGRYFAVRVVAPDNEILWSI